MTVGAANLVVGSQRGDQTVYVDGRLDVRGLRVKKFPVNVLRINQFFVGVFGRNDLIE